MGCNPSARCGVSSKYYLLRFRIGHKMSLDGVILTTGVKTDSKSLHPMTVYAAVMNIPTSDINSYPVPHRFQINDNRSKGVYFHACYLWIMAD